MSNSGVQIIEKCCDDDDMDVYEMASDLLDNYLQ